MNSCHYQKNFGIDKTLQTLSGKNGFPIRQECSGQYNGGKVVFMVNLIAINVKKTTVQKSININGLKR